MCSPCKCPSSPEGCTRSWRCVLHGCNGPWHNRCMTGRRPNPSVTQNQLTTSTSGHEKVKRGTQSMSSGWHRRIPGRDPDRDAYACSGAGELAIDRHLLGGWDALGLNAADHCSDASPDATVHFLLEARHHPRCSSASWTSWQRTAAATPGTSATCASPPSGGGIGKRLAGTPERTQKCDSRRSCACHAAAFLLHSE